MNPLKLGRAIAAFVQPGFIYLRTGGNGSGKTLLTLRDVRDLQVKDSRPVYFVEGRFTPRPILTDEFGWKPIKFEDWEKCEPGAIILCDEVQYDLPLRSNTQRPPQHIERLSEHRKHGFDFFMLTQHPMNIDAFARRLVQAPGYHQHFKRILGGGNGSSVLQWDAVNANCEKDGAGKTAQISSRNFPKDVYDWYDSAQAHTAKIRIPKQLWVMLASIIGIIVMVVLVVRTLYKQTAPDKPAETKPVAAAVAGAPAGESGDRRERRPLTAAEYAAAYQPRLNGLMHSAPAYDKLTEPRRVPVPAACIVSAKAARDGAASGCKCYTQDATPYPMPESMCRDMVAHGAFLAFQPEGEQRQQAQPVQQAAQQPQQGPGIDPGASNGLSVIPHQRGPLKDLGDAAKVSTSAGEPHPRVPKSSPWSFQAGG